MPRLLPAGKSVPASVSISSGLGLTQVARETVPISFLPVVEQSVATAAGLPLVRGVGQSIRQRRLLAVVAADQETTLDLSETDAIPTRRSRALGPSAEFPITFRRKVAPRAPPPRWRRGYQRPARPQQTAARRATPAGAGPPPCGEGS